MHHLLRERMRLLPLTALLCALFLLMVACAPAHRKTTPDADLELRLLHVNDTHAFLAGIDEHMNACFEAADCRGGLARISAAIQTARQEQDNVIALDAGDQFQGTLFYVIVLSLPIGFLSAVYKDTWFDRIMRGVVFATTAMPVYWVGLLLIWIVSIKLDLLPTSGYGGFSSLILPAFTVALSYISTYIRLIRNNMLENMREDYVLYAQARGLKQRSILVRHILKNSLQSCVTAIGMSIPQLIAGTIVVENVFAWPGVGRLCIASIFNRDYPVIQAYVLLVGVLFVFFNLFFDILQYVADPRLRERKA